jgi:hypothetical protein
MYSFVPLAIADKNLGNTRALGTASKGTSLVCHLNAQANARNLWYRDLRCDQTNASTISISPAIYENKKLIYMTRRVS